jgi:glycosyltransferase involved in cell wall biosynthesis
MPQVTFYEGGQAPSPRSLRELRTVTGLGCDVTVVHVPSEAEKVKRLGFKSRVLPAPVGNPYHARLSEELDRLAGRREILTAHIAEVARQIYAGRDEPDQRPDSRSVLANLPAQREELNRAKAERAEVAARMKAIYAARRTPTPLTGGVTFGDLARLESHWHEAARTIAATEADVLWAADLNALPPIIWASHAAVGDAPPVVFDSHESFTDLAYLPPLYRAAWRAVADRFTPLATVVVTVSDPIAAVLREEHGAARTLVLPNYAEPATATPSSGLRATVGLRVAAPLAVHIGNVGATRNPTAAIDLLGDVPDLHFAFVGEADQAVVSQLRILAETGGFAERLHFVPAVPAGELSGFLAEADMSVILYTADASRNLALAMPNKLFDSLAAGVPVVAAAGTAAADFLVEHGLGATFEPALPGGLGSATRAVLADPAIAARVRARRSEFVWSAAEPLLADLLRELLPAAVEPEPTPQAS